MLFLEANLRHIAAVLKAERPLALLSACLRERSDEENLDSTNRLASTSGEAGFGFAAIEGRWVEDTEREWWVLLVAERTKAPHLLAHARRWTVKFGRNFSIFRRS